MSSDTKWIIGTTIGAALSVAGLLTGLLLAQFAGVNNRMDRIEDGMEHLDNRLRTVEIGLAEMKALISRGGRGRVGGGGEPTATPLRRGN